MRKPISILAVLLLCLAIAPSVLAQGSAMPDWTPPWVGQIEEIHPAPWANGQYVTYKATFNIEGQPLSGDVRCALVGEETQNGVKYNWFELDIFNLGNLPKDMMPQDVNSIRVKILMKEYDLTSAQENPKELVQALANKELIKRFIFQVNEDTPQELDLAFLQMFIPMMEMSMEGATGMGTSGDMSNIMENIDWGTGRETVTTPAGTFKECLYLWFTSSDAKSNFTMKMHSHANIPLTVLVKLGGEIKDTYSGKVVNMNVELIGYGTNATSWVTGNPVMFSLDLMGMGNMMGYDD